jgi:hypothetical protein
MKKGRCDSKTHGGKNKNSWRDEDGEDLFTYSTPSSKSSQFKYISDAQSFPPLSSLSSSGLSSTSPLELKKAPVIDENNNNGNKNNLFSGMIGMEGETFASVVRGKQSKSPSSSVSPDMTVKSCEFQRDDKRKENYQDEKKDLERRDFELYESPIFPPPEMSMPYYIQYTQEDIQEIIIRNFEGFILFFFKLFFFFKKKKKKNVLFIFIQT